MTGPSCGASKKKKKKKKKRMMGLEPTTFCMANRLGRVGLAQDPHR